MKRRVPPRILLNHWASEETETIFATTTGHTVANHVIVNGWLNEHGDQNGKKTEFS